MVEALLYHSPSRTAWLRAASERGSPGVPRRGAGGGGPGEPHEIIAGSTRDTGQQMPDGAMMALMGRVRSFADRLMARRTRRALRSMIPDAASSVDLTIVGRTLLHAALVGAAAGLVGAAFFAGLEYVQRLLLEDLGGYHPLRA